MDNQTNVESAPLSKGPVLAALPPFSDILSESFVFYKNHASIILGVSAVSFILALPNNFLFGTMPSLFSGIFLLLTSIFAFFSRLALFETVAENGDPAGGVLGAYRNGLKYLISFAWASVLISFAVLGGTMLLIIPGILLSISLSMSIYVIFMEGKKGTQAMAASWHYVKNYWGQVFWRILAFGLIVFAVSILYLFIMMSVIFMKGGSFGVDLAESVKVLPIFKLIQLAMQNFLFIPLGIIYSYFIYLSLRTAKAGVPETDVENIKKRIVVFVVLGIFVLLALLIFAAFSIYKYLPMFFDPNSPVSLAVPSSAGLYPLLELFRNNF